MAEPLDEVLIVNKPKGWTSHDVVNKVRRVYGIKKVGHAGTLDPMATGILIVLVGKATKRQAEFMKMEKEYKAEITFGAETDTYDSGGKAIKQYSPPATLCKHSEALRAGDKAIEDLTREKVEKALKGFEGEIEQTVPPYSAVKVKGKKLYELARKGRIGEVDLPKRKVFIKEIELLDFHPYVSGSPGTSSYEGGVQLIGGLSKAKIRVVCSKGTYIRSLAHDLGKKLGCGAYLSELIRTRVGGYKLGSKEVIELGRLKIKE